MVILSHDVVSEANRTHAGIVPPCVANLSFGLGGSTTGPAAPGPCRGTCITWLEGPKACSNQPASFSSGPLGGSVLFPAKLSKKWVVVMVLWCCEPQALQAVCGASN